MPILLPPSVHDPRDIPIGWYRQIAEALYALSQGVSASGSGNLAVNLDRGGLNILDLSREWFIAELTGESSGAYAWRRLVSTTGGTNSVDGYGTAGTTTVLPAYEMNGATGIPSGTYVLMWPADSNAEMRFVRGLSSAALFTLAGRTGSSTIIAGDTLTILRTTVAADTATPDDASASLPGDVNLSAQTLGAGKKRVEKLSVDGTATALIGSPGSLPAGGLSLTNDAETGAAKLLLRYGGTVSLVDSTEVCSWRFAAGIDDLLIQQIDVSTGNPDGGAIAFVYTGDGADYAQSSSNVMISSPGEVWAYDRFSVGSSSGGLWSNRYQGATGTGGGGDTVKGGIITTLGSTSTLLDMGTW